jgi:hypothetical protein
VKIPANRICQRSIDWFFGGALLLVMAVLLTGCEVTDPNWQAREQGNPAAASIHPPPRQWDFMGVGLENRRMQDYNWP